MHRGPHPEDPQLFDLRHAPDFALAIEDYSWLLGRGYARQAGLTLVGDRFQLTQRQRVALGRCACSDEALLRRTQKWVETFDSIRIDGLNALTTVEAALAGGVVVRGRDGCFRDMASFHGNYRVVEEASPAIERIGHHLAGRPALWLLDKPVSNTGRLAQLLCSHAQTHDWPWTVELVPDPDALLKTPRKSWPPPTPPSWTPAAAATIWLAAWSNKSPMYGCFLKAKGTQLGAGTAREALRLE